MTDITLERTLPHNLEAERSILGAIILENRGLNQAQEILREEDFYRESHRKIYRVMAALTERSAAIDLITLKNELIRSGDLEAVGGHSYISSLLDGVPRSANVEHYARIIKEKAILRGLIDAGNRIVNQCYEGETSVGAATSLTGTKPVLRFPSAMEKICFCASSRRSSTLVSPS